MIRLLPRMHNDLQMACNREQGTRRDRHKPRGESARGLDHVVCGSEGDRPCTAIGKLHDEIGGTKRRGLSDDGESTTEERMRMVNDGHVTIDLIRHCGIVIGLSLWGVQKWPWTITRRNAPCATRSWAARTMTARAACGAPTWRRGCSVCCKRSCCGASIRIIG